MLDDYWDELLKKADHNEEDEIKFFCHCTTLKGKKGIEQAGCLIGGPTNLPARAPLASYEGLRGIWLAPALKELPKRSPYGSQRLVFRVRDIMAYLGQDFQEDNDDTDEDDKWNAPETESVNDKPVSGKRGKKKADRKKPKEVNRKQKECYLKNKIPEKVQLRDPLLFFECAHYFGSNQYVRLLLIRNTDPKVEWCRGFCKEIELRNNPFLGFQNGRIWTYTRSKEGTNDIILEVLVVGDIKFERLEQPPSWDVVGTMSRSGFDPRLGIC